MQPEEPLADNSVSRESATPADWRLVAVALAAVALSVFYIASNYRAAFPQASLKLELSREAITARAEKFLAGRGHRLAGFRSLTLFDADDDARLFLEREAGLAEANRLMEREVPVWRWRARWYKPPQKEEFRVWLAPDGRLTGFDHVMAEDAPGPALPVESARAIAQAFVMSRVNKPLQLVEEQSEDRPKRRDHTFTFERGDFALKDARIRFSVVVRGAQVEAYSEFLKVPEQWQRDFAALRSKNQLYSQIAQACYVALMLGAAITLIGGLRRGAILWRPVVIFSAVIAVLNVLAEWNNLPFYLNALPTTTPVSEGLVMILLQTAGSGAGIFIYVLFAAAPGLAAYRDLLPGKLSLASALSARALGTREFFRATVSGLGLAAAHLAFVTAFYLIGQRFGVWSPQDVEQSDLLSTFAPWLYPLTTSLLAASSEEFWFRLLAVPLVKRWTKSTALAILLPAFVWGFLHANYPQQPGYIRGVEVGLIGVVAGWFLLRFGILSTLIWHYTVDAILFSTYLLSSGSAAMRLSGLAVSGAALVPLAICVWRYRRDGGFLVDASLTNAALPRGEEASEAAPAALEPPLPPMWPPRLLYILALVLGAALLLIPARPAGGFIKVAPRLDAAVRAAGAPAAGELQAAEFAANLDGEVLAYLRQRLSREEADRVVRERTITGVWRVRQFAPSRKDERYRYVDAAGRVFRDDLILDEKEAGPSLTPAGARRIAEEHLRGQGIDLAAYRLVDSSAEKRDARADHSFVWEDERFRAGDARARVSVDVLGDRPSRYRRFLKLPEQWLRDHRKPRLLSMLAPAAAGGFAFLLIGVFLRYVRRAPLRAKRYLIPAGAAIALILAGEVNEWPQFYSGYSTQQPIGDFHGDYALSLAMKALLAGAGVFLLAYMLDVFLHLLQGEREWAPLSLPVAVAAAAAFAGAARLVAAAEALIPGDRHSVAMWGAPSVAVLSPAFTVASNAMFAAIVGALAIGLAVAAALVLFTAQRRLGFAIGIAACIALSQGGSLSLIAFHAVAVLALMALAGVVARTTGVGVTTIAASLFIATVANGAAGLWAQPAYRSDAILAVVAGAAMLAAFAYFNRPGRTLR